LHKKTFAFGVGTGLAVIAVLLYGAYAIQLSITRSNHRNELDEIKNELYIANNELEVFRNAQYNGAIDDIFGVFQIIDRAIDLGMILPNETHSTGTQIYDNENDGYFEMDVINENEFYGEQIGNE